MSNDVISEMLYGDRMIFAPDCDVAAGAVIKIKDKAGVALEDIAAGHDGEFCLCGPFTFACAKTAAFREGETVAFDPKTNLVVPLNSRGAFPLGSTSPATTTSSSPPKTSAKTIHNSPPPSPLPKPASASSMLKPPRSSRKPLRDSESTWGTAMV